MEKITKEEKNNRLIYIKTINFCMPRRQATIKDKQESKYVLFISVPNVQRAYVNQ